MHARFHLNILSFRSYNICFMRVLPFKFYMKKKLFQGSSMEDPEMSWKVHSHIWEHKQHQKKTGLVEMGKESHS